MQICQVVQQRRKVISGRQKLKTLESQGQEIERTKVGCKCFSALNKEKTYLISRTPRGVIAYPQRMHSITGAKPPKMVLTLLTTKNVCLKKCLTPNIFISNINSQPQVRSFWEKSKHALRSGQKLFLEPPMDQTKQQTFYNVGPQFHFNSRLDMFCSVVRFKTKHFK